MDAEIPSGFPNIKLSCWELESACAVEQRIGAASAFPSSTWRWRIAPRHPFLPQKMLLTCQNAATTQAKEGLYANSLVSTKNALIFKTNLVQIRVTTVVPCSWVLISFVWTVFIGVHFPIFPDSSWQQHGNATATPIAAPSSCCGLGGSTHQDGRRKESHPGQFCQSGDRSLERVDMDAKWIQMVGLSLSLPSKNLERDAFQDAEVLICRFVNWCVLIVLIALASPPFNLRPRKKKHSVALPLPGIWGPRGHGFGRQGSKSDLVGKKHDAKSGLLPAQLQG